MNCEHEAEFLEKLTKFDDRSKSNQHCIDALEKNAEAVTRLVTAVEVMATKQDATMGRLDTLTGKVEAMEADSAKKWRFVIEKNNLHCSYCNCDLRSYTGGTASGRRKAPRKKPDKATTSRIIAIGILLVDAVASLAVLGLCGLAIWRNFQGALPYLTTLIGALQAATGYVLGHYFKKSTKENTKGGIVYDAAMSGTAGESEDTYG